MGGGKEVGEGRRRREKDVGNRISIYTLFNDKFHDMAKKDRELGGGQGKDVSSKLSS